MAGRSNLTSATLMKIIRRCSEFMTALLSALIIIVLLFADGLIFGVAARKGVVAIVLIIIGLLLATFIGLGIPFLNANAFIVHVENFFTVGAGLFPGVIYAFPILWIVGFVVGLFV